MGEIAAVHHLSSIIKLQPTLKWLQPLMSILSIQLLERGGDGSR